MSVIKKYNNFLIGKLKYELFSLFETFGIIQGSSDFANRLKLLSKEKGKTGEIASYIYKMLNDFESDDVKQNYFDLTDKADMVSFAMQDRADKLSDGDANFLNSVFKMKGRGEVKIGKIIKYLCGLKPNSNRSFHMYLPSLFKGVPLGKFDITDKDVENFVNVFKATKSDDPREFKLVNDDEIAKYYNEDQYYNGYGSLGGSCMRNEEKGYFKLYSKNPDKVHLLILVDKDDKIHGRSLVWKLSKSPCEAQYLMDRIYTNSDADLRKFTKFAENQGWMYKMSNNSWSENAVKFLYNGKSVYGEVVVNVIRGDFNDYPFLDTMSCLSPDKKTLSNLSDKNWYFLHSTTGVGGVCDMCDGDIIVCRECDVTGIVECDVCDGSGEVDCNECGGDGEVECGECDGDGEVKCGECGGEGEVKCGECDGEGKVQGKNKMINCRFCKGTGRTKCEDCKGKGLIKCEDCKGKGLIKCDNCDGKGKYKCDNCDGKGKYECNSCELCSDCAGGHVELAKLGIVTKWNKRFIKK